MAIANMDSVLFDTVDGTTKPELLVSAALYLMSHYSTSSKAEARTCARLAAVIERHLKVLADLPGLAPVLQATCQQLSEQWAVLVEQSMPKPTKPTLFARMAGSRLN